MWLLGIELRTSGRANSYTLGRKSLHYKYLGQVWRHGLNAGFLLVSSDATQAGVAFFVTFQAADGQSPDREAGAEVGSRKAGRARGKWLQ
jgi:hypothetical protein